MTPSSCGSAAAELPGAPESPHPAIFAWDGGERFAFAAAGEPAGAIFALLAHTVAAQELTAVWEAAAGPCVSHLPAGCRALELHVLRAGLPAEIVALELDDLLVPDLLVPDLAGLAQVACAGTPAGLAMSVGEGNSAGARVSLNLAQGGSASFSRLRVGPLFDPQGGDRTIGVAASWTGSSATLSLRAPDSAGPLVGQAFVAHVMGAATAIRDGRRDGEPEDEAAAAAFAALAGRFADETDASGAAPGAFVRRGFRLLSAAPDAQALTLAPFDLGDEAIVIAPRGHLAAWSGEGEPAKGSRLFLSIDGSGGWRVSAAALEYRPARSTALAATGGGALVSYRGGATARIREADAAAALAATIWRRSNRGAPPPRSSWFDEALKCDLHGPDDLPPPLAALTRLGSRGDGGLSPVVAALGPVHGLGAAALEEVDALPSADRLALVLWFSENAEVAAKAVRRRIRLPLPAAAPPAARIARLLDWSAEPELRERLASAAGRIGSGAPAADDARDRRAALGEAADGLGEVWMTLQALSAAETALRLTPEPGGEAGPALRLLARLRADGAALAAAQAQSRSVDLAMLAMWRSGLADAAAAAGQPQIFTDDLADRLAALTATDILLLRRHLHAAAVRLRVFAAAREAIDGLDAAAGNGGLARRMDRNGDALIGMTRLGGASQAAVRALTRAPLARDALVTLASFIDRYVPDDPEMADPLLTALRRNLLSYGCLLLSQAIARECAAAFPDEDGDSGASAWRARIFAGFVETLPALVGAASAHLPGSRALGESLTGRLSAAA